jgi:uncharacterized protein with von Willebrand factor type A (vWA) domain
VIAGNEPTPSDGHLKDNIAHFARLLRACGLPIGSGQIIDALAAVEAVGITRRSDFYWALHAVLVSRGTHRDLFDQAFRVFWRNPHLLDQLPDNEGESTSLESSDSGETIHRRLGEALAKAGDHDQPRVERQEFDASLTWSADEVLRSKDFEQMSTDEMRRARRLMAQLRLPLLELPTRRFRSHPRGARVDMRATLRGALRGGPGSIPLKFRQRVIRPTPLVILCDISGSMSKYSRMLLHFAHALTTDRDRVHSFVFGTRLTNVTRYLRARDIDKAMDDLGNHVQDFDGGTRIGECLRDFNYTWSRRVLGGGAVVLLITDGLDRDAGVGLGPEIARLQRSCRRLIWLNPLMRYEGFEPRSSGMRTLLPHVDELRKVHNMESLAALCDALASAPVKQDAALRDWRAMARDLAGPAV